MIRGRFVLLVLALALAACGPQEDVGAPPDEADTDAAEDAADGDAPEEGEDGPVANACPPEGCQIEILSAEPDGDELAVTWEANFLPDVSRNHIHAYWDTYTADQVSVDADDRGVEPGEWTVTDAHPTFVTEGAVSTAERDGSTTLCATASDRDHAVIDAELVDCLDVSDALEN